MHVRLNSPQLVRRALQRSLVIAFMGLLYLSNVFAQTPVTTTTGGSPATATATATGTGTNVGPTGTATGTTPSQPTVSLSPMDPVGSLILDTPKPNSVSPPLFPIGVDIQFSWHYDQYLKLPPTNLTIEAYKADNSIVTIGQGLPGNLVNYTWTAAQQNNISNPLQTANYTLRIFDGAVGRFGRLPVGGYLSTFVGLKFGLYIPEAYTPGNQMNPPLCATCEFSAITNAAVIKTVLPVLSVVLAVLSSSIFIF